MNNQEIQMLQDAMAKGTVIWNPDSERACVVKAIVNNPSGKCDTENGAGGLCAHVGHRHYVSLDNCELSEFARVERLA